MKEKKNFCGAEIDIQQLAVWLLFFGVHPWSYINLSSEEIMAAFKNNNLKNQ